MIHGKDILIYEGDENPVAIAAAKSCTMVLSSGTIETSSPASNRARSYAAGRTDWTVTMDTLVLNVKENMLRVGEVYTITMGVRGSSTDKFAGTAICTECNVTGTVGNLAKGSFKFQGSDREGTLPPQPGETGYDITVDQVQTIVLNTVNGRYLSRVDDDTAQGLITFNGSLYVPTGQSIRIGDAYLTYDSENGMVKVWDGAGSTLRGLYATGAISALGSNSESGGGGGGGTFDRATLFSWLSAAPQTSSEWINAKYLKLGGGLTAGSDGKLSANISSITLTMPTGFTVTGSPLTSSGTIAVTLASGYKLLESGIGPVGTYTKVTVDTYGRVTAGAALTAADIPSLNYIPMSGSDSIAGTLEPLTNNSYNIGADEYRWKNGYFAGTVYATTFSGNATSATTATTASKLGSSTVGSGVKPIYLSSGTATESSSTVGSSTRPVYLSSGTVTQCGTSLTVSITGTAARATADGDGNTISSYYLPLSGGTMTGSINISSGDGDYYRITGSNYSFGLHLGNGATNRGIYDWTEDKWLLYFDASNTILNHGNVGIGTTSPSTKLHVAGSITETGYQYMSPNQYICWKETADTNENIQVLALSNANNMWLGYGLCPKGYQLRIGGGSIQFYSGTGRTSRMFLSSGGDFGIGTTSPSYKLDVRGVIYSNTGVYSAGYVTALSDERMKEVKYTHLLSIDEMADAPSVDFVWKHNGRESSGSIAQYWEKVTPYLVHENGDGLLSMEYGPISLMGMISLARKVRELEEKIAKLEKK